MHKLLLSLLLLLSTSGCDPVAKMTETCTDRAIQRNPRNQGEADSICYTCCGEPNKFELVGRADPVTKKCVCRKMGE